MSKLSVALFILAFLVLTLLLVSGQLIESAFPKGAPVTTTNFIPQTTPSPVPSPTPIPLESVFNTDVAFVLQAPFGDWANPILQDACEEASLMMAIKWAKGEPVGTPADQKAEILAVAAYETDNFGESRDTGAKDAITRIANGYYGFTNAILRENITSQDIIEELNKGNLLVIPMDGQALNNPNFTPPGPERHMLLVIGYDKETNEFITNDPGISQGKDYRYPVDIFEHAIRDYETGYHVPIEGVKKNIIVIQK